MSPAFLRPRVSEALPGISARSESAVVLSLNAWQVVGIALVVLCLLGLVVGWFWWQKRARQDPEQAETELPPLKGVGTHGTNTTTEAQEQEDKPPERIQDGAEPLRDVNRNDRGTNETNTTTAAQDLVNMFREPTQDGAETLGDVEGTNGTNITTEAREQEEKPSEKSQDRAEALGDVGSPGGSATGNV